MGKVLDGGIDRHLSDLNFHDSSVSGLGCSLQYYTSRSTPVFICYLDLSKAYDLVCLSIYAYSRLWQKLSSVSVKSPLCYGLAIWLGSSETIFKKLTPGFWDWECLCTLWWFILGFGWAILRVFEICESIYKLSGNIILFIHPTKS